MAKPFDAALKDLVERYPLKYNVLLHERHNLPVDTVLVLLRPQADSPRLTGEYRYQSPRGRTSLYFEYE